MHSVNTIAEMPLMAGSARDRYRGVVEHYLMPAFGGLYLRDLTPLTLQEYNSGFEIRKRKEASGEVSEANGARKRLSR